jgi:uncharacterized membrane protein
MRVFESQGPYETADLEPEKGLMESFLALFFSTVLLRPYVFIFLLIYLVGCSLHLGLKRALLFCIAGYAITWLSEYSSIHNGFPYGYYRYVGATTAKELWVFGVPFMDSLSYVFLSYASFSMAVIVLSPVRSNKGPFYVLETKKIRNSLSTTVLGALFMTYLDIIIDPVALRGDKWFLGKIHEYPGGGVYFGVPISNFLGWFLVGFVLIFALQSIDRYFSDAKDIAGHNVSWRYVIGPALYFSVIAFNLSITFFIGEYTLAWVGIFIVVCPAVLLYYFMKEKLYHRENTK